MIKLLGKIPHEVVVACSGGADSMSVLSFLLNGRKKVECLFIDHLTEYGKLSKVLVENYCSKNNIPFHYFKIQGEKQKRESMEEYWRNERYKIFLSFQLPIITCHHLDDSVETYLFTSFRGKSKTIPYRNRNVIRPFLLNRKKDLINFCRSKNVEYIEDESNKDLKYSRNRIRHNIIPEVEKIHPGIYTVVRKKILENFKEIENV